MGTDLRAVGVRGFAEAPTRTVVSAAGYNCVSRVDAALADKGLTSVAINLECGKRSIAMRVRRASAPVPISKKTCGCEGRGRDRT